MESFLLKLSVMLVPGMLAIVCHEVSHGYVAWRFGDPTGNGFGVPAPRTGGVRQSGRTRYTDFHAG